MPNRNSDSKLSGSSSRQDMPGISAQIVNPHLSREEFEQLNTGAYEDDIGAYGETGREAQAASDQNDRRVRNQSDRNQADRQTGSGSDKNSDTQRLSDPNNLQDKAEEDTFPASDPPANTPMTGVGHHSSKEPEAPRRGVHRGEPEQLPADFKDNKAAQFEYGRRSQAKTQHFDTSTRRLERGNPDVGEIDLGNIEANRPADPDDKDHFD